ncbi:hypothetical protein TeGR_g3880 [Tetraparma gracilis]|uniref:Uncharacterized protein n=1 Tax=Tetraparma gracilis TaxID=2962635 RepID=A0ABQ6MT27_9STRA|nr:hypothetical protein TeGR_g3880 [Tetraparma gracilis]
MLFCTRLNCVGLLILLPLLLLTNVRSTLGSPPSAPSAPYTPPRFRIYPTPEKSQAHWRRVHLVWRNTTRADQVLSPLSLGGAPVPVSHFQLVKKAWPHAFLGYAPLGHVVFVQRLGYMNLPAMRAELQGEDVIRHFVFCFEWCWTCVCGERGEATLLRVERGDFAL